MKTLADTTLAEFTELMRRIVREELAAKAQARKASTPLPEQAASVEAIAKVRRRLRRQGVAA